MRHEKGIYMKFVLHQQDITIGDLERACELLTSSNHPESYNNETHLHLWPEMFLGGYPLQDIVLDKSFITKYQNSLEQLDTHFLNTDNKNQVHLFGGIKYELTEDNIPVKIYNSIYLGMPGKGISCVYHKRLLPNYDIFDEQKYFTPGERNCFIDIDDKKFALIICEDMWHSTTHSLDPIESIKQEMQKNSISIDGIINLSASPYSLDKKESRHKRAKEISHSLNACFFYVNSLGLQDEILFDGRSFFYNGETFSESSLFMPQDLEVELSPFKQSEKTVIAGDQKNTWEDLFAPRINLEKKALTSLSDNDFEEIISAQIFAIKSYLEKVGIKKITLALSGGIDSALVLALAYLSNRRYNFGKIEAIYMPSQFSALESYELSKQMCDFLGIRFYNYPIKFLHQNLRLGFNENFGEPLTGLADENIQSRLRGNILFARSNQENSIVLNTSNKSELAVGYSTIYGDSVGALSVLGDLFKSEVYQLAEFLNNKCQQLLGGDIIPKGIITRPPSAELRDDQKDEDSLPPYERLDFYLESLLSHQVTPDDLKSLGFDPEEITKTVNLLKRSEYKRFQFCPIVKLKNKSFGFGRRMPILKK